ncbi:PaaX family transcriptional regulator C-terminal domain-containing protein [Roseovarius salis]|uniref:PaaX family transcriptional regulator C-terminal domain-containing protein n=1 Tax=Roseovarius salis TaxID=3376063 RepID=UPI0037CBB02D
MLVQSGPIKVWSVIVTVMGDLCQSRRDRIGSQLLNRLLNRMGITGQAARVAIHRLRRDGWIESERQGRTSAYFLSDLGWQQTQAVRATIYSPDPVRDRTPALVLGDPGRSAAEFAEALPQGALILGPRAALIEGEPEACSGEMVGVAFCPRSVPSWLQGFVLDDDMRAGYAALHEVVSRVCEGAVPSDALDRTVIRLLTLHHWRRLRLRHGGLQDALLPDDWEGARARDAVMTVLARYPRARLAGLAHCDGQDRPGST